MTLITPGSKPPPVHLCNCPGRWRRRRLGIEEGAVWECDECHTRWIWLTVPTDPETGRTEWVAPAKEFWPWDREWDCKYIRNRFGQEKLDELLIGQAS